MTAAPRAKSNRNRSRATPTAPRTVPVTGARHMHLGDALRVERRYVVDGALTSVTDEGRFKGVQVLGSTEHLLLEDAKADVRLIPLHTISEITIVGGAAASAAASFDPSFA